MEQTIAIPFSYIITALATILAGLGSVVTALVYVYKSNEKKIEKKDNEVSQLTRSFVEVTERHSTALSENTKVIEKLPEQFALHMKANYK
jgi:hypothetical protein